MKAALDILTAAPEFDLVLAVVGSSARFHPELAVQPIIDSAGAAKPIAAFLVPEAPEALARLSRSRRAELPHAGSLRRCHRGGARAARAEAGRRAAAHGGGGRVLDELEAYALLDRLGIRAHLRSRSTRRSRRRPPCLSPIRWPSRSCRPKLRTRPKRAASRSTCPTATR